MPNRFLHESICTSDTIEQLSPEEEVFFYRLLVQCDDFGRFDARPPVLLARCFPLRLGRVKESHIRTWLMKLQSVGLLCVYQVDGRPYLLVTNWSRYQQGRASTSRFPEPPVDDTGCVIATDINGYQPISDVPVSVSVFVSDSTSRAVHAKSAAIKPPPELTEFDQILREWPTYVPSERFYSEVLESYAHLPLREEAVKLSEWLRDKRKRRCSTTFVLNWLARASEGRAMRAAAMVGAGRAGLPPASVRRRPIPVSEVI